jgi:hypothetical protein
MRSGLAALILAVALVAPAAAAERNRFLQTVVPFLRKLRASAP